MIKKIPFKLADFFVSTSARQFVLGVPRILYSDQLDAGTYNA